MHKTFILSLLVLAGTATAVRAEETPTRQQMRDHFTQTMVQPCEGKKAGDKVMLIDRHGGKHEAVCTLTAVPVAE